MYKSLQMYKTLSTKEATWKNVQKSPTIIPGC